jgi:uncharacterized protein (DUF3820 family)
MPHRTQPRARFWNTAGNCRARLKTPAEAKPKKKPYDKADLEASLALPNEIGRRKMPFGKYKGRPFRSIPRDYLEWMCREFDKDNDLRLEAVRQLAEWDSLSGKKGGNKKKRRKSKTPAPPPPAARTAAVTVDPNLQAPWEGEDEFDLSAYDDC